MPSLSIREMLEHRYTRKRGTFSIDIQLISPTSKNIIVSTPAFWSSNRLRANRFPRFLENFVWIAAAARVSSFLTGLPSAWSSSTARR